MYHIRLEQEHKFRAKQFENAIADKARKILNLETEVSLLAPDIPTYCTYLSTFIIFEGWTPTVPLPHDGFVPLPAD